MNAFQKNTKLLSIISSFTNPINMDTDGVSKHFCHCYQKSYYDYEYCYYYFNNHLLEASVLFYGLIIVKVNVNPYKPCVGEVPVREDTCWAIGFER